MSGRHRFLSECEGFCHVKLHIRLPAYPLYYSMWHNEAVHRSTVLILIRVVELYNWNYMLCGIAWITLLIIQIRFNFIVIEFFGILYLLSLKLLRSTVEPNIAVIDHHAEQSYVRLLLACTVISILIIICVWPEVAMDTSGINILKYTVES